jgi:hypothetical protein
LTLIEKKCYYKDANNIVFLFNIHFGFATRCWRRTLKIKWTDRITNDEVFQRAKEERLLLKIIKKIDATNG